MDRPRMRLPPHLRAPLAGAGLALVAGLVFWGVQTLWLAATTDASTPSFAQTGEVRTLFRWMVALGVVDAVASAWFVRRWHWLGDTLRAMGVAMAIAGVLLFLLVLPMESLSNAGGVTPDLGHTLSADVELGPLALFLVWVAPFYGAAGRWARPRLDRPRRPWDLVACVFPAGHILGHAAVDAFEGMREASVGAAPDLFVSALIGAALALAALGVDAVLRGARPGGPSPPR